MLPGCTIGMDKKTLVVSLYGGPGSGKSTTCAGLSAALKQDNISCEQVLEYAKELVWENNTTKLADQIYIFGKQNRRTNIVLGRVDVIVTDSPLLLSIIYGAGKYPEFKALVSEEYKRLWTLNALVMRTPGAYQTEGREQDEQGALAIDAQIKDMLDEQGIVPVPVYGTLEQRVEMLKAQIKEMLAHKDDMPF